MTKGEKKKTKKTRTMKPGVPLPPPGPSTGPVKPFSGHDAGSKVKVVVKKAVTKQTKQPSSEDGAEELKGVISSKKTRLEQLRREWKKQKGIFNKYAGRAINPDGSEGYWEAKAKFDDADRRIKEIEKEIAHLLN